MDYSLLVGVSFSNSQNPNPKAMKGVHNGTRESYYFGIIDCLTDYNLKKKMANAWKRLKFAQSTLSTVHPDYYAERFLKFMTSKLLSPKDQQVA